MPFEMIYGARLFEMKLNEHVFSDERAMPWVD